MQRWLEEWETRQADLLRCIRSFETMSETWTKLAGQQNSQAYTISARKRARMYSKLAVNARAHFKEAVGHEISLSEGETLADHMCRVRLDLEEGSSESS